MNNKTTIPKNIGGQPKQLRVPAEDQEIAGYDAEGQPFYRRKASTIPGPRSGQSNRARGRK